MIRIKIMKTELREVNKHLESKRRGDKGTETQNTLGVRGEPIAASSPAAGGV